MAEVYDGAFRTIINDCSKFVIPFINEVFGESFTKDDEIVFHPNEHMINQQDEPDQKRITDTSFTIVGNERKSYHLECESSKYDGEILIRIFEYAAQIALDAGEVEGDTLKVSFPNSAVLFLRNTGKTPDTMHIIMETPGGSVTYDVPASRMAGYTLDDLFEKKLYMLLPFYSFNCEKDFGAYDTDTDKLEELKAVYRSIIDRLDELVEKGQITAFDKGTLLELSSDVLKELARKYSKVTEGIGEIMSGTMIETEARKILDQGEKKAEKKVAEAMLSDGKPVDEIIKYTGVTIETLQEIAKRLGLTITITEETVEREGKSE